MDQHARLVHLYDQTSAMARDYLVAYAPTVVAYMEALVREGMSPADAFALALDSQRQLFAAFIEGDLGDGDRP